MKIYIHAWWSRAKTNICGLTLHVNVSEERTHALVTRSHKICLFMMMMMMMCCAAAAAANVNNNFQFALLAFHIFFFYTTHTCALTIIVGLYNFFIFLFASPIWLYSAPSLLYIYTHAQTLRVIFTFYCCPRKDVLRRARVLFVIFTYIYLKMCIGRHTPYPQQTGKGTYDDDDGYIQMVT